MEYIILSVQGNALGVTEGIDEMQRIDEMKRLGRKMLSPALELCGFNAQ